MIIDLWVFVLACKGECRSECLGRSFQDLRPTSLPKAQQEIFAEVSLCRRHSSWLHSRSWDSHLSQHLLLPAPEGWCDFHWRGLLNIQQQLEEASRKTPNKMRHMMKKVARMSLCPVRTNFQYVHFPAFLLLYLLMLQEFKKKKFPVLNYSSVISVDAVSPFSYSLNLSSQTPKHLCNSW